MGARPGSVAEVRDALGNVTEIATSVCAHCQKITPIPDMKRMTDVVDYCRACDHLVCSDCAGKPCRSWKREMDRQEARARMFRDMGIG